MPDNITIHLKKVESPEALELAELYLMEKDLLHANHVLKLARDLQMAPELTEDQEAARLSLLRDGIVQFCACFGRTEPYRLDKDLVFNDLRGEWREAFNHIQDKRDAFAAHRFGADRQCQVTAGFQTGHTPEHVGFTTVVWTGFHQQDHESLLAFVGAAARYVQARIEELSEEVVGQLAGMSQAQLLALPDNGFTIAESRVSRSKHRKGAQPKAGGPAPQK